LVNRVLARREGRVEIRHHVPPSTSDAAPILRPERVLISCQRSPETA
jgi:hypothetical protein